MTNTTYTKTNIKKALADSQRHEFSTTKLFINVSEKKIWSDEYWFTNQYKIYDDENIYPLFSFLENIVLSDNNIAGKLFKHEFCQKSNLVDKTNLIFELLEKYELEKSEV